MAQPRESDLVEVANYPEPISAESVRAVLESEGIEAHVFGGELSSMNGLMTGAFGGVKVVVRRGDEARARELIVEFDRAELPLPDDAFVDDAEPNAPRCSACNSVRVRTRIHWKAPKDPLLRFFAGLFGGVGAARCRDCGASVRI